MNKEEYKAMCELVSAAYEEGHVVGFQLGQRDVMVRMQGAPPMQRPQYEAIRKESWAASKAAKGLEKV